MSAYGPDEVIERLEAALSCEHEDCMEQRRLTEQARAVAARLEAEQAALRVLLQVDKRGAFVGDEEEVFLRWSGANAQVHRFIAFGSLSDEAFALAASLEQS